MHELLWTRNHMNARSLTCQNKIHIFVFKVGTDTFLPGHKFLDTFANEIWVSESECIFKKKTVNKSKSVLHGVWSNEDDSSKTKFFKNTHICVEIFETARRAPLANLRNHELSLLAGGENF